MATILNQAERAEVQHDRTAFNTAVWDRIIADPEIAKLPYRIETDEHGQMIISPSAAPAHGSKQSRICWHLRNLFHDGEVMTECPVSTAKGVKTADVAWCSESLWAIGENKSCFPRSPEICVEVLSRSNTESEISEKRQLYFGAGAREVWICSETGEMSFYSSTWAVFRRTTR